MAGKQRARHYARYCGGNPVIRHSGRLQKVVPFTFAPKQWVEIPLDPYWSCNECNRKILKGLESAKRGGQVTEDMKPNKTGKPTYCGNEIRYMESISNAVGNMGAAGQARLRVCTSKKFHDNVQRKFFKMKADLNETWEYKTE